jgi:signal transduction histidine kinase
MPSSFKTHVAAKAESLSKLHSGSPAIDGSHGTAAPHPAATPRPFNLTRWFSLLSFACIGVVSVVSSVLLSRFLTDKLLERDAGILMEVVQSLAEVQDMSAYFLGLPTDARDRNLEEFFTHVASLPDVLRTNIYARDQKVIWSSDHALIGKHLGLNHELEEALEGKVAIESGVIGAQGDPKPEHLLLRGAEPRFVENYLPVRLSSGGPVVGVVEVYRVPVGLFETINHGLQLVWAIALGGGLFLYVTLFWIVRRANRVIEEQSERLLEAEMLAVIGEMTGAIAHGIRNPLASIRTSAELCQDDASPDVREAARDITNEVDRLTEWVRQLLTYSQKEPARLEPVDLGPLIAASLAGFEREMQRCAVTLATDIEVGLPPVRAERVRLGHALNSLLANALEAMPNGGRLEVAAKLPAETRMVRLTIRDNGVGISRDQLPRVFAPFFTSKRKGLGLGLPLVKRIVTRFGGTVSITSEPGRGAQIVVELPVHH